MEDDRLPIPKLEKGDGHKPVTGLRQAKEETPAKPAGTPTHGPQFRELIRPFPPTLVHKAPQGKFGDYVAHFDVEQAALRVVGPHDFQLVELIRGLAPKVGDKYAAREGAVVGVIAELRVVIDGRQVVIREVGTEDNPAMNTDAENAKLALSDAYKRCWMRAGLALHLWCNPYWLEQQVEKDMR